MTNAKTLEELFIREFNSNVKKVGNKDIHNIPLPKSVESWNVSGTEMYAIKGITNVYKGLNKTTVLRMPKGKEVRKRVIDKAASKNSIKFEKDEEGKFKTKAYSCPSGSVIVISETELDLPFKAFTDTIDGFDYIDYVKYKGKKSYLYAVPTKYLYKVNQTALALTVKSMTCYNGYGYKTWNNGAIFLYVIPYNPNAKYDATLILKTGYSLNYSKEIKEISDYWEGVNLIPNISLSALQDGSNLALKGVTITTKGYVPVDNLPLNKKEIFNNYEETTN